MPTKQPQKTIFSKIIDGEMPAEFIFQDELWVAFLDVFPASPGHCLLVPRQQTQYVGDLSPETIACMGAYIAAFSTCIKKAADVVSLSILIRDGNEAGQEVPHVHVHCVPRSEIKNSHDFRSGSYGEEAERKAAIANWGTKLRAAWTGI